MTYPEEDHTKCGSGPIHVPEEGVAAMTRQEWIQSAAAGGVPVPDSVRERLRKSEDVQ